VLAESKSLDADFGANLLSPLQHEAGLLLGSGLPERQLHAECSGIRAEELLKKSFALVARWHRHEFDVHELKLIAAEQTRIKHAQVETVVRGDDFISHENRGRIAASKLRLPENRVLDRQACRHEHAQHP
jgi:hypothetical protein